MHKKSAIMDINTFMSLIDINRYRRIRKPILFVVTRCANGGVYLCEVFGDNYVKSYLLEKRSSFVLKRIKSMEFFVYMRPSYNAQRWDVYKINVDKYGNIVYEYWGKIDGELVKEVLFNDVD